VTHGKHRGHPPDGPIAAPLFAAPLGLALAILLVGPVLGHGPGGPWLTLEPYQVNPGGTIEVRGDNLGADEEVTITLVVAGRPTDLGVATTDGEGHLSAFVTIPADVPAADYGLIGRSVSGSIARGTFTVAGPPIVDQGGGGDPYERGPILSPPPITAPEPAAGAAGTMAVPVTRPTEIGDVLVLVAAIALPLAAGLALLSRRRRTPAN
jgi:hypothetical protein